MLNEVINNIDTECVLNVIYVSIIGYVLLPVSYNYNLKN